MNFWTRLETTLNAPIGQIIQGLLAVTLLLALLYSILRIRKRNHDRLAYLYETYYQEAERQLTESFAITGVHRATLFGRETRVKELRVLSDGRAC